MHATRIVMLLALTATATPGTAATYIVTRFDDPLPGGCLVGDCSLREAVVAANALPGLDQVLLDSGTYTLSLAGASTPLGNDLDVTDRIEIIGSGATQTTVRAAFAAVSADTRVVQASASLRLQGLTMQGGSVNVVGGLADGGCVRTRGVVLTTRDLIVRNCAAQLGGGIAMVGGNGRFDATTVRDNSASSRGGGLHLAAVTVDGSGVAVLTNSAALGGGGVHVASLGASATTTLRWETGSMIVGNTAADGGGVSVASGAKLELDPLADSTPAIDELLFIAGNVATASGGGLRVDGTLEASRLAVRANAASGASSDGGGLHSTGVVTVIDSEFQSNTAVRDGGGAIVRGPSSARFERVSFADNDVGRYGGGLSLQAYAILINVATYANAASSGGGLDLAPSATGRIYHLSTLADTGNAVRIANTWSMLLVNSVISGGCTTIGGASLSPSSSVQSFGFASCGALPAYSPAQLGLTYAYTGGRFDVVAIGAAGSALRNAAPPVVWAPNDIRGWTRVAASDIGAHEFDAIAP